MTRPRGSRVGRLLRRWGRWMVGAPAKGNRRENGNRDEGWALPESPSRGRRELEEIRMLASRREWAAFRARGLILPWAQHSEADKSSIIRLLVDVHRPFDNKPRDSLQTRAYIRKALIDSFSDLGEEWANALRRARSARDRYESGRLEKKRVRIRSLMDAIEAAQNYIELDPGSI